MPTVAAGLIMLALAAAALPGCTRDKIRVLIVDGQNNHRWDQSTPLMKKTLENTGRFTVEVATTPPEGAPAAEWDAFRPDFSRFNAVLSNYNDYPHPNANRWPARVEAALEAYVAGGGGLVIYHAANNAFEKWDAYNRMIGLGWRHKEFGDRLYLDEEGSVIRVPKGQGADASHGAVHAYTMTVRDPKHPVMKGMPPQWMHADDELYHAQRGPAENLHVLASAFSDPKARGTGLHEPLVWTVEYGRGRVLVNLLGHVMTESGTIAVRCVGFQTLLCRGTEWAATGRVTLPIPKNFPTPAGVSLAEP